MNIVKKMNSMYKNEHSKKNESYEFIDLLIYKNVIS